MSEREQAINLQIDHPEVDDLQDSFQAASIEAHVLSLIHRWPYEQLRTEADGKKVLELGCNKGFGTIIYADRAASVKAADTSVSAIEKAVELNARGNVEYICLDSWTLPFADDEFDVTVLFQVIEHIALDKLDIFLREIRRVTRADGQVILSTPNRNIRLLPFQRPWNEFHTREYSARDLHNLLNRYFPDVRIEGLFGIEALNRIERGRVKQKASKIYFTRPLKKYLVKPIRNWLTDGEKSRDKGKSQPVTTDATTAESGVRGVVETATNDYPFATTDLELRVDSLDQALDLRATVLQVK